MATLSDQMANAGYKAGGGTLSTQMGAAGMTPITPVPSPSQPTSMVGTLEKAVTAPGPATSLIAPAAKFLTSSEQGLGGEIAAALGANSAIKTNQVQTNQATQNLQTAIQARNKLNASGVDTSHADQMISDLIGQIGSGSSLSEVLPHVNDTPEDVALNAVGVALDALTGGTYGAASKATDMGAILSKATPTAMTAAEKATTAISDKLAARSAAKSASGIAKELTPILTPTKYKAAAAAGNTTLPTLLKAAGVSSDTGAIKQATQAVYDVASKIGAKVTDIVKPGATASSNVQRIGSAIGSYSKEVVEPFLSAKKVPTNFGDFIDYMKNVRPPAAIQSDAKASVAFNRVRERVISTVYSSVKNTATKTGDFTASTDLNDYWNARKTIDSIITDELGAKTFTDPAVSGIKAAARTLRSGVADFISDALRFPGQMDQVAVFRNTVNGLRDRGFTLTTEDLSGLAKQLGLKPTGAEQAAQWDAHMSNLNNLYRGQDNLLTKVAKENGKNAIQIFTKRHPIITRAAEYGAGAIGAGALFGEGQHLAESL